MSTAELTERSNSPPRRAAPWFREGSGVEVLQEEQKNGLLLHFQLVHRALDTSRKGRALTLRGSPSPLPLPKIPLEAFTRSDGKVPRDWFVPWPDCLDSL